MFMSDKLGRNIIKFAMICKIKIFSEIKTIFVFGLLSENKNCMLKCMKKPLISSKYILNLFKNWRSDWYLKINRHASILVVIDLRNDFKNCYWGFSL